MIDEDLLEYYLSNRYTQDLTDFNENLKHLAKTMEEIDYSNRVLGRRFEEEYEDIRSYEDLEDFLRKYKNITDDLVDNYTRQNRYAQENLDSDYLFSKKAYSMSEDLCNSNDNISDRDCYEYSNLTLDQICDLKKAKAYKAADKHLENNKDAYEEFGRAIRDYKNIDSPSVYMLDECSDMISSYRIYSKFCAMGFDEREVEDKWSDFSMLSSNVRDNLEYIQSQTRKYYYITEDYAPIVRNMQSAYELTDDYHQTQEQSIYREDISEYLK